MPLWGSSIKGPWFVQLGTSDEMQESRSVKTSLAWTTSYNLSYNLKSLMHTLMDHKVVMEQLKTMECQPPQCRNRVTETNVGLDNCITDMYID